MPALELDLSDYMPNLEILDADRAALREHYLTESRAALHGSDTPDWGRYWANEFKSRILIHNSLKYATCKCNHPACRAMQLAEHLEPKHPDIHFDVLLAHCEAAFEVDYKNKQNAFTRIWNYLKGHAMRLKNKALITIFTILVVFGLTGCATILTDWEPEPAPAFDQSAITTIQHDCFNPTNDAAEDAMMDPEYLEDYYEALETCQEIAAHYDEWSE